jgi:hypothetical protein
MPAPAPSAPLDAATLEQRLSPFFATHICLNESFAIRFSTRNFDGSNETDTRILTHSGGNGDNVGSPNRMPGCNTNMGRCFELARVLGTNQVTGPIPGDASGRFRSLRIHDEFFTGKESALYAVFQNENGTGTATYYDRFGNIDNAARAQGRSVRFNKARIHPDQTGALVCEEGLVSNPQATCTRLILVNNAMANLPTSGFNGTVGHVSPVLRTTVGVV